MNLPQTDLSIPSTPWLTFQIALVSELFPVSLSEAVEGLAVDLAPVHTGVFLQPSLQCLEADVLVSLHLDLDLLLEPGTLLWSHGEGDEGRAAWC